MKTDDMDIEWFRGLVLTLRRAGFESEVRTVFAHYAGHEALHTVAVQGSEYPEVDVIYDVLGFPPSVNVEYSGTNEEAERLRRVLAEFEELKLLTSLYQYGDARRNHE